MIAFCGLDCSKCEGYLATQADSDSKRNEVAKKWSALYRAAIKPNQINCDGCKSEGRKFFIVKIRAKFANAVFQKALTIAQLVMNICVKPYQHSLNWHLKQVNLLSNFVSRKCK